MGEPPGPLGPPIGDFIIPGGAAPGVGPGAAPGISAIIHQLRMSAMRIGMPQLNLRQASTKKDDPRKGAVSPTKGKVGCPVLSAAPLVPSLAAPIVDVAVLIHVCSFTSLAALL
jgi:hypothetical protein